MSADAFRFTSKDEIIRFAGHRLRLGSRPPTLNGNGWQYRVCDACGMRFQLPILEEWTRTPVDGGCILYILPRETVGFTAVMTAPTDRDGCVMEGLVMDCARYAVLTVHAR